MPVQERVLLAPKDGRRETKPSQGTFPLMGKPGTGLQCTMATATAKQGRQGISPKSCFPIRKKTEKFSFCLNLIQLYDHEREKKTTKP